MPYPRYTRYVFVGSESDEMRYIRGCNCQQTRSVGVSATDYLFLRLEPDRASLEVDMTHLEVAEILVEDDFGERPLFRLSFHVLHTTILARSPSDVKQFLKFLAASQVNDPRTGQTSSPR